MPLPLARIEFSRILWWRSERRVTQKIWKLMPGKSLGGPTERATWPMIVNLFLFPWLILTLLLFRQQKLTVEFPVIPKYRSSFRFILYIHFPYFRLMRRNQPVLFNSNLVLIELAAITFGETKNSELLSILDPNSFDIATYWLVINLSEVHS